MTPPYEDLVERVARAISVARSWQTTPLTRGDWDCRDADEREPFLQMARAVIEATRIEELHREIERLREALSATHKLVASFAVSGFTDHDIGMSLYRNQAQVHAALTESNNG